MKKRADSIREQKEHFQKLPYKPNNDQDKIDEINEKKKIMVETKEKTKEKRDKIDNYAKYVREMYWPKVSVKKQLELEHVKNSLKVQPIRKSQESLHEDPVLDENGNEIVLANPKKHLNYERPWRDAMSKKPNKGSMDRNNSYASLQPKGLPRSPMPDGVYSNRSIQYDGPNTDVRGSNRLKSNRHGSVIDHVSSEMGSIDNRKPRYANDYLSQMRMKRELKEEGSPRKKTNNEMIINSYLKDKNLNEYEKMEAVKRKAVQMENRARMQEKLIQYGSLGGDRDANDEFYADNVEKTIQVNDMYIDAIQAKLRILDQI